VDGHRLPSSSAAGADSLGRALPHAAWGRYVVGADELWLVSMRVPNSWDSGEGQGSRELGGGAVTLGAWLALGTSLLVAVERTVTVMVVACPHMRWGSPCRWSSRCPRRVDRSMAFGSRKPFLRKCYDP